MKTHKNNTENRKYQEGVPVTEILKFACVYFSTAFTPNINGGEGNKRLYLT